MNAKLNLILNQDELKRIHSGADGTGTIITVDLHKLSTKQAKRLLKNIIALEEGCSKLRAIHGYNHGTAIRTMIMSDLLSPKIRSKEIDRNNPGLTNIELAA